MKTYYIGTYKYDGKNQLIHGRTKGSRNGISTTPGYTAIGELAQNPSTFTKNNLQSLSNVKTVVNRSLSNGKQIVNHLLDQVPLQNQKNNSVDYERTINTKIKEAIRTGDQSYFGRGGTVDLDRRPVIPSDWLVEMGYDAEIGGTATVFSHSTSIGDNGEHAVTVTPILPNGDVLERDVIEDVLDNIYLGRDGKPHLDGDDWGFELSDILVSHYDVSGIPPEERSNYINAMANGLHEVQEALYQGVEPIAAPTSNIQPLRKGKETKGKDWVRKMFDQRKR